MTPKISTALVLCAALALAVPAMAGAATPRKKIVPVLECVVTHADGTYTANFGYLNGNKVTIDLAPGSEKNDFSPAPDTRGQPASFEPGRSRLAFQVTVPTAVALRWTLDGDEAHADRYSRPCVTSGRITGSKVRMFWTNGSWKTDRWGLKSWFDLPCNPLGDKRLDIDFNRAGAPYNRFRMSSISWAFCWNDPLLDPGRPAAGFDTSMGLGLGVYNGRLATIEWLMTDRGERGDHRHWGRAVDRVGYIIRDSANRVVLAQERMTMEGNVQAQP